MTLKTETATTTDQAELLRKVLRADAASSAGLGVVLAAASGPLGGLLGLSMPLMICAGIALLFGGAALGLLADYPSIPTALARAVLAVNSLMVVGMLLLAFLDPLALTGLGTAFAIAGAVIVAVFTDLEFLGLRRMTRPAR